MVADVTPTSAATVRLFGDPLVSGMCSSILRVPAATTLGHIDLSVENTKVEYAGTSADDPRWQNGVEIDGFTDAPSVPPRTASWTWSRGEAPFDIARAEIHASLGKAVLTTGPVPYTQSDHVHMLISVPPKYSVAQVVGYIKGKSAIHVARTYLGKQQNFVGQNFWARGYFVSTVGRDEAVVREYIRHQETEDKRLDQLRLW